MRKSLHSLRLFLCTFSGEDDYIIRKCKTDIQFSFALIGFFVLLIFCICWASALFFVDHIFEHNPPAAFFVALIWSLLVTNLYLLLLYTISPILLPIAGSRKNGLKIDSPKPTFTTSFIFRIFLIILMAIIISQPYNVLLFSPSFDQSHQYVQEIRRIVNENPLSWAITFSICIIFLLPIYWKYSIRNRGGFYEIKKEIEHRFVIDNYLDFRQEYANLLSGQILRYNRYTWEQLTPLLDKLREVDYKCYRKFFNEIKKELEAEEIMVYEYWADHPFRTKHKRDDRKFASEADFLKEIYSK